MIDGYSYGLKAKVDICNNKRKQNVLFQA